MRSVLSFLLGVVALVVTAAAVPALWLERNVVDESGYVALVEPLGDDDAFQDALARTIVDGIVTRADLPAAAAERTRPVLLQVAGNLTQLPGYADAWTETNRRSHASVFGGTGDDDVTIDVAPLARLVVDEGAGRLAADLPAPSTLPVVVAGADARSAVDQAAGLDPRAYYLAGGAVLAAVLCLLLARRRSTPLMWLGIGVVVVAALLKGVAVAAAPVVAAQVQAPSDLAERVVDLLEQAARSSFDTWLLVLAAGGAAMFLLGIVARLAGRGRTASA